MSFYFGSGFLKLGIGFIFYFFIFFFERERGKWDCIVGRNVKRLPLKLKFLLDLYSFRYQYFFVRVRVEGFAFFCESLWACGWVSLISFQSFVCLALFFFSFLKSIRESFFFLINKKTSRKIFIPCSFYFFFPIDFKFFIFLCNDSIILW